MMPFNNLGLCAPFPSCLQSFPASGSLVMTQLSASDGQSIGDSAQHQSSEYSGVISFRIDWLDLLAVQGTLKSLLQHHSSKASILRCSAFFMVQLSHLYMITGKTIALSILCPVLWKLLKYRVGWGGVWRGILTQVFDF